MSDVRDVKFRVSRVFNSRRRVSDKNTTDATFRVILRELIGTTILPLILPFIRRRGRAYRRGYNARGDNKDYHDDQQDHYDDNMDDHADDESDHVHTKAMSQPKVDYWAGYYDFLINEGSYKFWAVFQVNQEHRAAT